MLLDDQRERRSRRAGGFRDAMNHRPENLPTSHARGPDDMPRTTSKPMMAKRETRSGRAIESALARHLSRSTETGPRPTCRAHPLQGE